MSYSGEGVGVLEEEVGLGWRASSPPALHDALGCVVSGSDPKAPPSEVPPGDDTFCLNVALLPDLLLPFQGVVTSFAPDIGQGKRQRLNGHNLKR